MPAASTPPVALASRIEDGSLILSAVSDLHERTGVVARVQRVAFDGRILGEESAEAELPPDRAVEVARFAVQPGDDYFLVIDARRRGELSYDPLLRLVTLPEKPKRYDLPMARVTAEPIARRST